MRFRLILTITFFVAVFNLKAQTTADSLTTNDSTSTVQKTDSTNLNLFTVPDVGEEPELITNAGDLVGYLQKELESVHVPPTYKKNKRNYILRIYYTIEIDGSVSDIIIRERDKNELGEANCDIIITAIENTEWKPAIVDTKPVRVINSLIITIHHRK